MNRDSAIQAQPIQSIRQATNCTLQRQCACGQHTVAGGECVECKKKREGTLQRAAISAPPLGQAPPIVHDVLRAPGQPLDASTRAFMEPRFGHDFSRVRVHANTQAAKSARAVNALAYTVGRDVVFGAGQYAPGTVQGQRLMAHELTHVVQQRQTAAPRTPQFFGGDEHKPAELEAESNANQIITGKQGDLVSAQPEPLLQRKLAVEKPKDLIDNPTGKGLVHTNAQTVEGYLRTLCSGGTVSVNKGNGDVSLAASFCPTPMPASFAGPPSPAPADKSKEPTGCNCLCDMVGSGRSWIIAVDDDPTSWPHTSGQTVTTVSPNSSRFWGTATESGKATVIDPWLVLSHELCGHAWLDQKGLPDNNANRGEGGHQETVERENELRKEHGIEARGRFKDPYCGESFYQDKAGPGPVKWSKFLQVCEAWRKKTYGGKYKISDKIP